MKDMIWQRDKVLRSGSDSAFFKFLSKIKKRILGLPSYVKWFLTLVFGAVLAKIVDVAVSTYFSFGFADLTEVNQAFKIQFMIDLVLVLVIVVLIGIVVRRK